MKNNTLIDSLIAGFKTAITELEEFQLQAALGKAEAADAFERAKLKFNAYIQQVRRSLAEGVTEASEKSTALKKAMESLQLQLALGKAESQDLGEAYIEKTKKLLDEIRNQVKSSKTLGPKYEELMLEMEKFRIKLEIFKLHFYATKLNIRQELNEKKAAFLRNLAALEIELHAKEKKAKEELKNFREDISGMYSQLKNIFAHA